MSRRPSARKDARIHPSPHCLRCSCCLPGRCGQRHSTRLHVAVHWRPLCDDGRCLWPNPSASAPIFPQSTRFAGRANGALGKMPPVSRCPSLRSCRDRHVFGSGQRSGAPHVVACAAAGLAQVRTETLPACEGRTWQRRTARVSLAQVRQTRHDGRRARLARVRSSRRTARRAHALGDAFHPTVPPKPSPPLSSSIGHSTATTGGASP